MVLLTLAVVAGVIAVATGVLRGGLDEPAPSVPARGLPTDDITGRDVAALRFVQGLRGYRMDQVDAALDTLALEVDRLRAQVAQERSARLQLVRAGATGTDGLPFGEPTAQRRGSPERRADPATGPITAPLRRPRRRAESRSEDDTRSDTGATPTGGSPGATTTAGAPASGATTTGSGTRGTGAQEPGAAGPAGEPQGPA